MHGPMVDEHTAVCDNIDRFSSSKKVRSPDWRKTGAPLNLNHNPTVNGTEGLSKISSVSSSDN